MMRCRAGLLALVAAWGAVRSSRALAQDPPCPPADTEDFCSRDRDIFEKPKPGRAERLKAQNWLQHYDACAESLNAAITTQQAQLLAAAGGDPSVSRDAATRLDHYKRRLMQAQLDQHAAYRVIQAAYLREFDYALWDHEALFGLSVLGGAGHALAWGPVLQGSVRDHSQPGFKFALSLGAERTSNLNWNAVPATSSNVTLRDGDAHWTYPLIGTANFGWTHSWFLVGAGAAVTPERHAWTLIGRLGIGILTNMFGSGPDAQCETSPSGLEAELRFIVQPWIPLGQAGGPVSILFGAEVSSGKGWGRSAECPYQ